jgi:hypothetical protein
MYRKGRPPAWSPEQRERVLELADEGATQRKIAEHVFGDARYRGRVERILRERVLSGRDPGTPPRAAGREIDLAFEAGDMTSIRTLVARYERGLLESDETPAIAEIDRLLKIKLHLERNNEFERLRELTREHNG